MHYSCPACSAPIEIDLTGIGSFSLHLKCPKCSKLLSLSDSARTLVDVDRASKEQQLSSMVQMALADGSISREEIALLRKKAVEFDIDESALDDVVSQATSALRAAVAPQLEEAYCEKISSYINEDEFYDWQSFAAKVANLSPTSPHLKSYRNDLVTMISFNADKFKELARKWDRVYENSSDSTEWDEILENKNRCLEVASALRNLRDGVVSQEKAQFLPYVRSLAAASAKTDGW